MKKLTDEEIIKALECCGKEYSCEKCILNTWLNKKRDCVGKILGNALDLINRQKAEIERLKPFEKKVGVGVLKNLEQLEYEKAEAYKEFAERLKEKMDINSSGYILITEMTLVNLLKELTEESNGE